MESTLLLLANSIRKKLKRVAYVRRDTVFVQLTETGKGIFFKENTPLPTYIPVPPLNKYAKERLKKYEEYEPTLLAILEGEVTTLHLLRLADAISRIFLIGDCYIENQILYVNGKPFTDSEQICYGLPTVFMKKPTTLEELERKCRVSERMEDGNAILIDGAVYVAKHRKYLDRPPEATERCCLFGYLMNGEIVWDKVNKSNFVTKNTPKGKILVTNTVFENKIRAVFKSRNIVDYIRVKESPYPIAILEDGEFTYFYSEKIFNL